VVPSRPAPGSLLVDDAAPASTWHLEMVRTASEA
jgi:hypothetical protein